MNCYDIRKSKGRYREIRDHNKSDKLYQSKSSKQIKIHANRSKRRTKHSNPAYTGKRMTPSPSYLDWNNTYSTFIHRRSLNELYGDMCPQCEAWFCIHSRYVVTTAFLLYNNVFPKPIAQIIAKMVYNDKQWVEEEIGSYYQREIYNVPVVRKNRKKHWWE